MCHGAGGLAGQHRYVCMYVCVCMYAQYDAEAWQSSTGMNVFVCICVYVQYGAGGLVGQHRYVCMFVCVCSYVCVCEVFRVEHFNSVYI